VAGSATLPPLAPLDARLSAYFIDGLILFAPTYPVVLSSLTQRDIVWWPFILWVAGINAYFTIFWSRFGRGETPGTRIRRIRVVREDGRDLSLSQVRSLVLFFGLGLGIVPLSVLLDRDGIGLHDRRAATRVIRVTSRSGQP
jgi:uncharacterized RDD family membrane protein YckC